MRFIYRSNGLTRHPLELVVGTYGDLLELQRLVNDGVERAGRLQRQDGDHGPLAVLTIWVEPEALYDSTPKSET